MASDMGKTRPELHQGSVRDMVIYKRSKVAGCEGRERSQASYHYWYLEPTGGTERDCSLRSG